MLALFTAVTVILGLFATFRIGNQIKIPLKFISVFMTGALFGPLCGGLVAATADLLNAIIMPVGPVFPQITAVEFIYGMIFGFFFYNIPDNRAFFPRAVLCSFLQFLISLFIMSKILTDIGYFSSFNAAVIIRFPAAILTLIMHIIVLCVMKSFIFKMRNILQRKNINGKF